MRCRTWSIGDGAIDPGSIRGDIEFDHVDFGYGDGKLVLNDFCLKVKQRRDDRAGRRDGRRQVDHREFAVPLLRTGERADHDRRARITAS